MIFRELKEKHPLIFEECQKERHTQSISGNQPINLEIKIYYPFQLGGFNHIDAVWGEDNWEKVLTYKNFQHFYDHHPSMKKNNGDKYVWENPTEEQIRDFESGKVDYSNGKPPFYYIGLNKAIEAMDVVQDFNLNYNLGTAVTYLLRAKRKNDGNDYSQDVQKAINHLQKELDWIQLNENK